MDNGHVIEGTCICINYWKKDDDREYKRFLTHLNSDYSSGFGPDFQECIHTSPVNAWLITNRIGVSSKYIMSLSIEDSHILYDESTKKNFSVTVIDANHNAGSVMFIFQGDFGNILYTGYFRYNIDMLQHPVLKSIIETKTMDVVYFDNTYAAEHCVFPSKEETLGEILPLLSQHPDHTIIFGIASFGKEELLFAAAKYLNEQIYVSESKLQVLSQIGFEEMFTTDPASSRIILMDIKDISFNAISYLKLRFGPVLTILPSALYHTVLPISSVPFREAEVHNIHIVPYSNHSSHSELIEFIHCIKPESVIPIIDVICYKDLSQCLDRFWADIWKNYVIPSSIMSFSSSLESPLNLSPPDASIFNSENDNDIVAKINKSNNRLITINNNKFRKCLFSENIHSGTESNVNNKITLNNETVEYACPSANNVSFHTKHEETRNNVKMCGAEDFINTENNFDCFDTSEFSTDDESNIESSHLDSVNCKYEKSVAKNNVLSRFEQNCESAWHNVTKESRDMDCGRSQAAEYFQHPLKNVKHKFSSSTNIDKRLLAQVVENCQHPLNNTKITSVNSTNADKDLLSQMTKHCQNPFNNVQAKYVNRPNIDKVTEYFHHPLNNIKHTFVSSTNTDEGLVAHYQHILNDAKSKYASITNIDKDVFSQMTEHCQYGLNNVKNKCAKSTNIDKELSPEAEHYQYSMCNIKSKHGTRADKGSLLQVAEHIQSISDNPVTKCDKSTNTDKVLKTVKQNSLPSVSHCGRPEDLDVGLLIKVYEEEKRLSAQYRYGYVERRNISNVKCTDLNSKDSEKYVNKNGYVKEVTVENCSDSVNSSPSTEIYRQSLATPELSINCNTKVSSHKRKLMDSVIYNKWKLNKTSIAVSIYERNYENGSCSIKRKKMVLKSSY